MSETRRILLGVTGGIAAYKSCETLRLLQKSGFDVRVVMTEAATHFVGPVTFEALSGHPVGCGMFDDPVGPIPHIALAQGCDLFMIAPATADVVAKIACGIADDLLTATALALPPETPLLIAPAMNVHMYQAASTRANLETLRSRGITVIDADQGPLACGDEGPGRMPAPEELVAVVRERLGETHRDFENLRLMITAGPTQEPLDAVRFLSNRSSGKMGYALAQAALDRGATVTLVTGPVALAAPEGAEVFSVATASEMYEACDRVFANCDVGIFTAAVADFRPARPLTTKLKKQRDGERLATIDLVENPDILAAMAERKTPSQTVVGFAAETENVIAHGREKLVSKGADMIVANAVGEGRGFNVDDDEAALITDDGIEALPLMSKRALADRILDAVLALRTSRSTA